MPTVSTAGARPRRHHVFAKREAELRAAGCSVLGRGDFACVLAWPDGRRVTKLVMADDRPFLAFLELIRTTSSPHWPVVHDERAHPEFHEIAMERLMPLGDSALALAIEQHVLRLLDQKGALDRETAAQLPDDPGTIARFRRDHASLADAAALLVRHLYLEGAAVDLQDQNIMRRGPDPVFVDPAAWG